LQSQCANNNILNYSLNVHKRMRTGINASFIL